MVFIFVQFFILKTQLELLFHTGFLMYFQMMREVEERMYIILKTDSMYVSAFC